MYIGDKQKNKSNFKKVTVQNQDPRLFPRKFRNYRIISFHLNYTDENISKLI